MITERIVGFLRDSARKSDFYSPCPYIYITSYSDGNNKVISEIVDPVFPSPFHEKNKHRVSRADITFPKIVNKLIEHGKSINVLFVPDKEDFFAVLRFYYSYYSKIKSEKVESFLKKLDYGDNVIEVGTSSSLILDEDDEVKMKCEEIIQRMKKREIRVTPEGVFMDEILVKVADMAISDIIPLMLSPEKVKKEIERLNLVSQIHEEENKEEEVETEVGGLDVGGGMGTGTPISKATFTSASDNSDTIPERETKRKMDLPHLSVAKPKFTDNDSDNDDDLMSGIKTEEDIDSEMLDIEFDLNVDEQIEMERKKRAELREKETEGRDSEIHNIALHETLDNKDDENTEEKEVKRTYYERSYDVLFKKYIQDFFKVLSFYTGNPAISFFGAKSEIEKRVFSIFVKSGLVFSFDIVGYYKILRSVNSEDYSLLECSDLQISNACRDLFELILEIPVKTSKKVNEKIVATFYLLEFLNNCAKKKIEWIEKEKKDIGERLSSEFVNRKRFSKTFFCLIDTLDDKISEKISREFPSSIITGKEMYNIETSSFFTEIIRNFSVSDWEKQIRETKNCFVAYYRLSEFVMGQQEEKSGYVQFLEDVKKKARGSNFFNDILYPVALLEKQ